jgi:hypothetical protein
MADAVTVTPDPVAALGVSVVDVEFMDRYGPSPLKMAVNVQLVCPVRDSFLGS